MKRYASHNQKSTKKLTAKEFDRAFEKGDITKYLDYKSLKVQRSKIRAPKKKV